MLRAYSKKNKMALASRVPGFIDYYIFNLERQTNGNVEDEVIPSPLGIGKIEFAEYPSFALRQVGNPHRYAKVEPE